MTLSTDQQTATQYKYYRITRSDGYISYCTVLNWLEGYFNMMYGKPREWEESEDKASLKGELIPFKVVACASEYTFIIELIKNEYVNIPLRCMS